jgi:polysaccharide export outer membrane protein
MEAEVKAFKFTLALGLTLVGLCGCMGGGESTNESAQMPGLVGDSGAMASDILRVGDAVQIRLTGVPVEEEKLIEEKVDDDGYISMPLGGRFKADGLTTSQVKAKIEKTYREKKIYETPNVTIITQQRYANVSGEVRIPQRVLFTNDLTVLRAITACGGFTDYANRQDVKVLRKNQVFKFNAVEALKNPGQDIPLQAGDQIQVPRTIF